MWDLPGPGLEPVSPALAGGFLTTAPPGESANMFNHNIKKKKLNTRGGKQLGILIQCHSEQPWAG